MIGHRMFLIRVVKTEITELPMQFLGSIELTAKGGHVSMEIFNENSRKALIAVFSMDRKD